MACSLVVEGKGYLSWTEPVVGLRDRARAASSDLKLKVSMLTIK